MKRDRAAVVGERERSPKKEEDSSPLSLCTQSSAYLFVPKRERERVGVFFPHSKKRTRDDARVQKRKYTEERVVEERAARVGSFGVERGEGRVQVEVDGVDSLADGGEESLRVLLDRSRRRRVRGRERRDRAPQRAPREEGVHQQRERAVLRRAARGQRLFVPAQKFG